MGYTALIMKLNTIKNRTKLAAAIALGLVVIFYFSIPAFVIAILIGLLFIPPALLFASVFKEGVLVIVRELGAALESGKQRFVISISKESIVLEPNVNR